MDAAWSWTLAVAALVVGVHLATVAFASSESVVGTVGASPGSTLSRPWTHLSAPFFHHGWGHLAYNLAVLFAALPVALRAFGVGRGLAAGYAISPVAGIAVNLLVVLPLAHAGVALARAALDVPLVGASVVAFGAAGLACAALLSGHGLGVRWSVLALAAFVAYELALRSFGFTQHFVWLYHVSGFGLGFLVARLLP